MSGGAQIVWVLTNGTDHDRPEVIDGDVAIAADLGDGQKTHNPPWVAQFCYSISFFAD